MKWIEKQRNVYLVGLGRRPQKVSRSFFFKKEREWEKKMKEKKKKAVVGELAD